MAKLVCVDLDGTLLRSDLSVSSRSTRALMHCRALGHRTAALTGRAELRLGISLPDGLSLNDLFDALALSNGAVVTAGGMPLCESFVRAAQMRSLHARVSAQGFKPLVCLLHEGAYHMNFPARLLWPDAELGEGPLDLAAWPHDLPRMLVVSDPRLTRLTQAVLAEALSPGLKLIPMDMGRTCAVVHEQAGKDRAMQTIAAHYGIRAADTLAFGDDLNDLAMFAAAGCSLAMGNAPDEVKRAADVVILSNDEDGVARYLEEELL